jgi:hypothetical protein
MRKFLLTMCAFGSVFTLLSQAGPIDRIKERKSARNISVVVDQDGKPLLKIGDNAAPIVKSKDGKLIAEFGPPSAKLKLKNGQTVEIENKNEVMYESFVFLGLICCFPHTVVAGPFQRRHLSRRRCRTDFHSPSSRRTDGPNWPCRPFRRIVDTRAAAQDRRQQPPSGTAAIANRLESPVRSATLNPPPVSGMPAADINCEEVAMDPERELATLRAEVVMLRSQIESATVSPDTGTKMLNGLQAHRDARPLKAIRWHRDQIQAPGIPDKKLWRITVDQWDI